MVKDYVANATGENASRWEIFQRFKLALFPKFHFLSLSSLQFRNLVL